MTTNSAFNYRSVTNGSAMPVPVASTRYALLGLRLPAGITTTAQIGSFFAGDLVTGLTAFYLAFNPTVAGTFTYSAVSGSSLLTATGALTNTVTANGTVLASGLSGTWISAGFTSSQGPALNRQIPLDVPGDYVLVGMYLPTLTPSQGLAAMINWIESVP